MTVYVPKEKLLIKKLKTGMNTTADNMTTEIMTTEIMTTVGTIFDNITDNVTNISLPVETPMKRTYQYKDGTNVIGM